jgi:hypothetical protein
MQKKVWSRADHTRRRSQGGNDVIVSHSGWARSLVLSGVIYVHSQAGVRSCSNSNRKIKEKRRLVVEEKGAGVSRVRSRARAV